MRTRLEPEYTRRLGCEEIHAAFYYVVGDDGRSPRHTVVVQLPEDGADSLYVSVKMAAEISARIVFLCDTAEQANACDELVAKMMPNHVRVAPEKAAEPFFTKMH